MSAGTSGTAIRVVPERVTPGLVERLVASRCRMTLVLHADHAAEIDDDAVRTLAPLVARARALVDELVDRLPGYLVPTPVCELAGRTAKTRL